MEALDIRENEPLAAHTTFRIGGNARYFARVSSENELADAITFAHAQSAPVFILGGGSNLLVADSGFEGLVIKNEIKGVEVREQENLVFIDVGAGESWDGFVEYCINNGYWGIENLSAIPGTVGAAPVQNIGAYGIEVKDAIESVRTVDIRTGEQRTFSNTECGFSYRESFFKTVEGKNFFITHVEFRVSRLPRPNLSYKDIKEYFTNEEKPSIVQIRDAVVKIRSGKFPDLSQFGTAGSFWKNQIISIDVYEKLKVAYPLVPSFPAPEGLVKIPLAWILDHVCGLKGHKIGKVSLYKNQPLVLYAESGATASEVEAFATAIERAVKEKTGIDIEREVKSLSC
ncbi:MAG: UDP-N-acetylmuramate dehydrogenase [bacterium]|nr:UDP-N-acetylmuramate dehydrogenase [bacterium]